MMVGLFWCLVEAWKDFVEVWLGENRRKKTRVGCAVTSAVALAFGRYSARPSGLGHFFGSGCSTVAPTLGCCSATLFPEGYFWVIS